MSELGRVSWAGRVELGESGQVSWARRVESSWDEWVE